LAGDVWIPPFPIAFARRDKVARFPRSIAGECNLLDKRPCFSRVSLAWKEDGWWVQFFEAGIVDVGQYSSLRMPLEMESCFPRQPYVDFH
jgi:hypothetical protein